MKLGDARSRVSAGAGGADALAALAREIEILHGELEQTRARMAEMAQMADQDMLLPILNRRAFMREISRFIAFAERYGTPSSVIYVDLNNFKAINDKYGHAGGDEVLRHFATLLASQIRESDVIARIGGDEFAMILAHVRLDQARKKAADLAEFLRENPPVLNGEAVALGFAFGAYELQPGTSVDMAIAEADKDMYAQKRVGRPGGA
jgi:diguanylate cyclase (GGDEF)-like protein